jgi:hypothetical protein
MPVAVLTACPPNWWRSAATALSAGEQRGRRGSHHGAARPGLLPSRLRPVYRPVIVDDDGVVVVEL